jgi:hypothetical protein
VSADRRQMLDDQLSIRLLLAQYCDVATRRAWAEMPPLFRDDAVIELDTGMTEAPMRYTGGAGIGEFIGKSLEAFAFFEIVPLNSVATVTGDTATGRLYIQEIRLGVGSGHLTYAFGCYTDRYERAGDGWRFAARSYRSLARTSPALHLVSDPMSLT